MNLRFSLRRAPQARIKHKQVSKSRDVLDGIHGAVTLGKSVTAVSKAIKKGMEIDELDCYERTALFYAIRDGNLEIVRELVRHGSDVNHQDDSGKTPLHCAAAHFQPKIATFLLDSGSKVDTVDVYGNTPLSDAVFSSRSRGEVIFLLLEHGADRHHKNNYEVSPFSLAQTIANYDMKQFFVD